MKKFTLSAIVIVSFVLYVIIHHLAVINRDETSSNLEVVQTTPAPVSSNPPAPASISSPILVPPPDPAPASQYKDGIYTGSVADAFYGNIQVRATISNGKITDIVFLQYPNDRDTSREINGEAMPILKQEAIQAQNANVDIVSGATQSSGAFRESLGAALTQAQT